MNKDPLVSVIIATYNRKDLIGKAIKSVLEQTYNNYEVIIIDDGSTDGTKEEVQKFLSDKIKYFYQKNAGPDVSRDFSIKNSRGEYIAILDSDDYWIDKDKLKKQIEFLNNNFEYVLVGGNVILIDNLGKKIKDRDNIIILDKDIREKILIENPFAHSTVMYRKSAWENVGGYGKNKKGFSEDWNLWLKMGKIGKMYNFNERFTCFKIGGGYSAFWKKRSVWLDLGLRFRYRKDYPNFIKGFFLGLIYYFSFFIPFRNQLKFLYMNIKKNSYEK